LDGVKSKQGFDDLAVDGDIEDYLGSKQKERRKKSRDYLEIEYDIQEVRRRKIETAKRTLLSILLNERHVKLRHLLVAV
jgi:hypothetical protein